MRSTAKEPECDTITTPSDSMVMNCRPMLTSCDRRDDLLTTTTPKDITNALTAAPSIRFPPSSAATATPGNMP